MTGDFRTCAVLGAGVMGGGIAAHLANAGCRVLLLDRVPEGAKRRSQLAESALERLAKSDPPAFMHKSARERITPGNIEDDLNRLGEADWVIEAVVEDRATKRDLYARIAPHLRADALLSSNTSTLTLGSLIEGQPEDLARRMAITHFFNPPRYIRLLELVTGPATSPEALDALAAFGEDRLGKTVVRCADRPGFIANRIGCYWLLAGVAATIEHGLSIEEADAAISGAFAAPRTGLFGLLDLVGLDLIPSVASSLRAQLPTEDPFHALPREPAFLAEMIEAGYTGRKGKGGFYRLAEHEGERVKEARDLTTGSYRAAVRRLPDAPKRGDLEGLLGRDDRLGRFADEVVPATLAYAARVMPEVVPDVAAVDRAMRLGYAWGAGPFEMMDRIGPARLAERLDSRGIEVPALLREVGAGRFYETEGGKRRALAHDGSRVTLEPRPGTLRLEEVKRGRKAVESNASASLWDLGDGILGLEFHTKLNTLDPESLAMMGRAVERVPEGFRALVIGHDGDQFSAGVNLGLALYAANLALWPRLEEILKQGQAAMRGLKYAPFPVVAAPSGMALGGGCEILLHCDAVEAHAETYVGLVETGAGLVPAWGGTTQYLLRWLHHPERPQGPMPAVKNAFETIALAKVARSAAEARDLLFLRPEDGIHMHRDRVLAAAKERAIALADDYRPPAPPAIRLPGRSGRIALKLAIDGYLRLGKATQHDTVVAQHLAAVLTGGDTDPTAEVTEDTLLGLERGALLELIRTPATLARMEHLLETGKPLRN